MNININKLATVVIKDYKGSEMCRVHPESAHIHNVSGKQYLTLINGKADTPVTNKLEICDKCDRKLRKDVGSIPATNPGLVSEDLLRDFIGLRNNVSKLSNIKSKDITLHKVVESQEDRGVISVTFTLKEGDVVLDTVNSNKTLTDLDYFKDNYENLLENCTKHAVYAMFLLLHVKLFT